MGKQKRARYNRVKHMGCKESVVYKIPLSSGRVYMGHVSRCLNIRLCEHCNGTNKECSYLNEHLRECRGCKPRFRDTQVVKRCRVKGALLLKSTADYIIRV